jgi:hypothetical protein
MDFQLTKARKESRESMYIRLNSAIVIMSTMLMKSSKYTRGFPVDQGKKRAARIHVYQIRFSNSNNEYNVNKTFQVYTWISS